MKREDYINEVTALIKNKTVKKEVRKKLRHILTTAQTITLTQATAKKNRHRKRLKEWETLRK